MLLGRFVLMPEALWAGASLLLGLIVGSFANVCIHRIPRGLSVVTPRSRCPGCGVPIAARDNVPVLSYLLLRGRCRSCGAPISPRYPAIEAANGLMYAGVALVQGPTPAAGVSMAFVTALLVLAFIDLDHKMLPDVITVPGIVLGIASSPLGTFPAPWGAALRRLVCPRLCLPAETLEAAVAALAGYLTLALIAVVARWYYGREALGRGDWKLMAMIGAFRGGPGMWVAGYLGSLLGACTGAVLVLTGRAGGRTELPLGTFLCAGAILELFAGAQLLAAYRRLFTLP